jgi:hypothetical protein
MTISLPVGTELVSTNVVDTTQPFSNTVKMNYSKNMKLQHDSKIYINSGEGIIVPNYLSTDTYVEDDIVFRDSYVQKVKDTEGVVAKQPEEYTSVETSYDNSVWDDRYMKFADIGTDDSVFGVSIDLPDSYSGAIDVSSDGLKLYRMVTGKVDKIYQYTMTTANDISTATDSGVSLDISAYPLLGSLSLSSDGSRLFLSDYGEGWVRQFNLSVPYNISTATDSGVHLILEDSSPLGLDISQDGYTLFVTGLYNEKIYQYNLTTPNDLSTAVYSGNSIQARYSHIRDVVISTDGTKMYELSAIISGKFFEYDLSTPFVLSTAQYNGVNFTTGTYSFTISTDGKWVHTSSDKIYQYNLNTLWDISTMRYSIIPFTYSESRGGSTYTYSIEGTDGNLVFRSNKNGNVVTYSPMYQYNFVTQTTNEPKAYLGSNGTWVAKTVIIRPDGLYIRTTTDAAIETKEVVEYQTQIVNSPADIPGFVFSEVTDDLKPLDGKTYTKAVSTSPMNYLVTGETAFDTVALGGIVAENATVTFTLPVSSPNYDLWLDGNSVASGGNGIVTHIERVVNPYLAEDCPLTCEHMTQIFYSTVTMEAGSTVTIELTGGEIKLGTIMPGKSIAAGFSNLAMSHSYKDFSYAEYDDWGNLDYVEKQKIIIYNGTVTVKITDYDRTVQLMTAIGKNLIIVNGSTSKTIAPNSQTVFASTQKIGRFMSFSSKTKVKDDDIERNAEYNFVLEELA